MSREREGGRSMGKMEEKEGEDGASTRRQKRERRGQGVSFIVSQAFLVGVR